MAFNAARAAEKYKANTGGTGAQYWLEGVQGCNVDPTALAAQKSGYWQQRVMEPQTKTRFERGLARSGKAGWLDGCQKKGQSNYSTGTAAGADKLAQHFQQKAGAYEAGQAAIRQMPKGGLANAKARANAWIDFAAANLTKA